MCPLAEGSTADGVGRLPTSLALEALWGRLVGSWTGRFCTCSGVHTGWRRGLSITFRADSKNGTGTQRCSFGHDRLLKGAERLDVQTRESTDDAFAVTRSGIWRRTVISTSCSKNEAKEVEKSRQQCTFRNIKSSEPSATQSLGHALPNPTLGRKLCPSCQFCRFEPDCEPSQLKLELSWITANIY